MVLAPEHPYVSELVKGTEYEDCVNAFIKELEHVSDIDRTSTEAEKKGMVIGHYCINPLSSERIPIYIANYVLADYGTGAIMAVPAHDERDLEFAKKYNIEVKTVIRPEDDGNFTVVDEAYIDKGIMVNSGEFNGLKMKKLF